MSGTQPGNDTATDPAGAVAVPMRLEVVVVPSPTSSAPRASNKLKASKAGHKPPG